MSNISRRNFLKGVAASAVTATAIGAAHPSAALADDAPAIFNPGTYTCTQVSAYATVEVTCTFSETALTDVSYNVVQTSNSDYFTPFASEMEKYCASIVENGKVDGVDGVTGASICTSAIKDGVNECTAQALGLPASASAPVLNPQVHDYESFDGDLDAVFSPIKLGSMEISGRVIKSAGSGPWSDANGDARTVGLELYGAMADGGVPLNIIYGGLVYDIGLNPYQLEVEGDLDAAIDKIRPIVDRLHKAGSKVGFQMAFMSLAPSVDPALINGMSTEEVKQLVDYAGISAERVQKAGFDCIEIKGASADALNSFLSRRVNQRTDEYGPQSIENRTRLFCESIQKIKEVCGADYPVGAIINAVEENDINLGDNALYTTIEESKEIAKALVAAGADWLQVRAGAAGQEMNIFAPDTQHAAPGVNGITGYGTQFDYSSHYDGLMDGSRDGYLAFLPMVKAIKEVVDVPVGCACGLDLRVAPDFINEKVKNGELDLVFMNRPLNVDPYMLVKLKEHRREDITPCMRCMHCHDKYGTWFALPNICRMNATTENSLTDKMPEGMVPLPAEVSKNVMIVGAGPAGLECARVAAERGHNVTIYDVDDKIGGLMNFARGVKGNHERFDDYFVYMNRQLENNNVSIVLNTRVDANLVASENPDAVVIAAGGIRESKLTGDNVFSPEGAFGSAKLGQHVVILGGNAQAVDFALNLIAKGKKVTMVHNGAEADMDPEHSYAFKCYFLAHLRSHGVKIFHEAEAIASDENGVTIVTGQGLERTIPCDSIVEFYDMLPNTELADELSAAGYEVHVIGDADIPCNIAKAVTAGNLTARAL